MSSTATARQPERLLDLRNTLDDLVADGLMDRRDANYLAGSPRSRDNALLHPITFIAKSNLPDQQKPGKLLDEERLTQWMAEKSGQPYYHIDPLKVDVSKTTEVMSFAFAKRHQILCVQVGKDEILIASSQPWIYAWKRISSTRRVAIYDV